MDHALRKLDGKCYLIGYLFPLLGAYIPGTEHSVLRGNDHENQGTGRSIAVLRYEVHTAFCRLQIISTGIIES